MHVFHWFCSAFGAAATPLKLYIISTINEDYNVKYITFAVTCSVFIVYLRVQMTTIVDSDWMVNYNDQHEDWTTTVYMYKRLAKQDLNTLEVMAKAMTIYMYLK